MRTLSKFILGMLAIALVAMVSLPVVASDTGPPGTILVQDNASTSIHDVGLDLGVTIVEEPVTADMISKNTTTGPGDNVGFRSDGTTTRQLFGESNEIGHYGITLVGKSYPEQRSSYAAMEEVGNHRMRAKRNFASSIPRADAATITMVANTANEHSEVGKRAGDSFSTLPGTSLRTYRTAASANAADATMGVRKRTYSTSTVFVVTAYVADITQHRQPGLLSV